MSRPRPDTVRIQVQDLRVGDRLWPTLRTVTQAPTRGLYTPRGKSDLALDGSAATWGTYTRVSVIWPRPEGGR